MSNSSGQSSDAAPAKPASDGTSDMSSGSASSTPSDQATTAAGAEAASSGPFVTVPPSGAWRATDLEGKDVYDPKGDSIGEITDVLVSKDGKVMAVLVGVGGFLGIGEKDVAVSMTALEFGPGKTEGLKSEKEAAAETTASTTTGDAGMATGSAGGTGMAAGGAAGGGTATPAASAEPQKPVVGEDNLPDRIVLNVSRDQLENAPAYNKPKEEKSSSSDASTAPAAGSASTPATGGAAAPAPADGGASGSSN
ncbi:PRC-barrel domain-containing protein [Jiella sp. CQZ9-1]|uniref:PRC-barrel domain-containing protein n=2 Tax=Jiella flava TaxID=2816857 RepID=A0A939JRG1_9HYPH|nr:PRC-barrel domain-containing protein [Jiella flava]